MIRALIAPSSTVAATLTSAVPVSVRKTFSSSRCTPPEKTWASRSSAWYPLMTRTPPNDSVRRPVTSPWILRLSRKAGRRVLKAYRSPTVKTIAIVNAINVIETLM